MQKMNIANSDKPAKFYSIDIVLTVGYRTNSSKAIKFRQWASKILKQYIIDGYAVNKEKLQQKKLDELTQTLALIQQSLETKELSTVEAKGFVEIISNYAKSWAQLQGVITVHELVLQLQNLFGVMNSKHNKIGYVSGVCSEHMRWDIWETMEKSLEDPKSDLGD